MIFRSKTFPTLTWTTRPDATIWNNQIIFISDVGTHGSFWVSNGTLWVPMNGHVLLHQSNVASSTHTGTTSETVVRSVTLPGGIMGTNGCLWVHCTATVNNNANSKTIRAKLNNTAPIGQINPTSAVYGQILACMGNRNAANSQVGSSFMSGGNFSVSGSAINTGSVDTSSDFTVDITVQLANTGDTAVIESLRIWLQR